MAANDPISKVVACQFSIDYSLFDFEIDTNFNFPNLPGLGNLIFSFFEAVIETMLFFLKPLNYILNGKIPDLLDWIATATVDPIKFIKDGLNLAVIKPYTEKLKVSSPDFMITGLPIIGELPCPAINPNLPGYSDNVQWTSQINGFISLLTGLIKLPINVFIEIFKSIIEKLEFPAVGKPLFDKVWELVVPGLGLPTIEAQEVVIRLGKCFNEQIEDIIPAGIPIGGAKRQTPPPTFAVTIQQAPDPDVPIQNADVYSFRGVAVTHTLHIQWTGTDYSIESISLQNGAETPPNYFSCTYAGFNLNNSNPDLFVPLSLNITGKLPIYNATVMIKVTSPTKDVFTFGLQSYKDNPLEVLRKYVRAQTPVFPGPLDKSKFAANRQATFDVDLAFLKSMYDGADLWDNELNIFGIRKVEGPIDQFEDMIGFATRVSPTQWEVYSFKGTTRPTAYWRNAELTDPNQRPKGVDTVQVGFYPSMWKKGDHPVGPQPNCLIMNQSTAPFQYCIVWRDIVGNGNQDPSDKVQLAVVSFNNHQPGRSYSESSTPSSMGKASAGCQVLQSQFLFNNVYSPKIYAKANKIRIPNRFAYSLMRKENVSDLWTSINPYTNTFVNGFVGTFTDV